MSDASIRQVNAALARLQPSARPRRGNPARPARRPRGARRGLAGRAVRLVLGVAAAVARPFIVLVRLSVYLYQAHGLAAWPALGLGAGATALLLVFYLAGLSLRLRRRWRPSRRVVGIACVLVGIYCGYALRHIEAVHVKSPGLRETYTALHPVLRLAVSTLTLVDAGLVMTDTERGPEDYARMGLAVHARSRHYRQADGYAHAVDVRTRGRAAWANRAVAVYFELMGFRTLRHVGTADHLHVSLPARINPLLQVKPHGASSGRDGR